MLSARAMLILGALAAAALAGAGLIAAPGLLAWPGGEIYGHAWVQWWWGAGLDPAGLAEGAKGWSVIDPATTALAAGIGRLAGPAAAWNGVALGGVAACFAGGAALARRCGGDALVGGATLALAPIYLGSLASGLSEDAALGLVALALALLAGEGWRSRLAGGLLLGLSAWFGLYLALIGAGLALVLGLGELLRSRRPLPWVAAAGLALAGALPAVLAQGARIAGEGHRLGSAPARYEPLWRVNPWRGADLASFFAPGAAPLQPEDLVRLHPTYLGFVALGLAVFGGWSRWWVALLGAMAVSTGAELSWAGQPLGVENPLVVALAEVPGLGLVNHHGRLMMGGAVALAVLAGRGARRLSERLAAGSSGAAGVSVARTLPAVLALAIAAEISLLSPAPLPLPTTPAAIDPIWSAISEGEGRVLVVPLAGPGVNFQRPLYEQRAHGRPLALHVNRPGQARVGRSALARWLLAIGQPGEWPLPAAVDPSGLVRAGIGTVVAREGYVEQVSAALGEPDVVAEGGAAWNLR